MSNNKRIYKRAFSLSDQSYFAQRLSLLLESGVSIVEALSMMENMETLSNRKKIYRAIVLNVEKGISLSKSIKSTGVKWNSLLITLIQNGESGGRLAEALSQAHKYINKKDEMKKKLISSLVYPGFIVFATLCMTLFLILYIFPKILPLLSSLDIQLPLITRVVQGIYQFLVSYGLFVSIFFIIFIPLLLSIINKNNCIKYRVHLLTISFPFVGKYIKIYLMSSICSMGEMLLSSGKGLPDMLIFSKESSGNVVYKKAFGDIYKESVQGISLSISLKKYNSLFPPLLSLMCALGERTGSLGNMLGHCSYIFEQDMDNFLKRFSSLIEPTLMVFMGLIVGGIALSIILPVYEITNHLTK